MNSIPNSPRSLRSRCRVAVPLLLVLVGIWLIQATLRYSVGVAITDLRQCWRLLIPVLSGWLLWRRCRCGGPASRRYPLAGSLFVLAGVLTSAVLSGLASDAPVSIVWIVVSVGIALSAGGTKRLAATCPVLLYTCVMFPLPRSLAELLSTSLAAVEEALCLPMLTIAGVPAIGYGSAILTPAGAFDLPGTLTRAGGFESVLAAVGFVILAMPGSRRDKLVALCSGIPIGVIAGCLLTAAGVAASAWGLPRLGAALHSDIGGLLILPLSGLIAYVALHVPGWLLVESESAMGVAGNRRLRAFPKTSV